MKGRHYNYQYVDKFARAGIIYIVFLLLVIIIGDYVRYSKMDNSCSVVVDNDITVSVDGESGAKTGEKHKTVEEVKQVVKKGEKEEIKSYIRTVYGEYAEDAFKLLECENKTLDPHAVNDNTKWGGVGRDRGIFQINSYFHPLTDAQAFDWKQNIDYSYRMFVNDDYTFVRWTCGRN